MLKRQERARQEQLMLAREGSNITGGSAARQVDKFLPLFRSVQQRPVSIVF